MFLPPKRFGHTEINTHSLTHTHTRICVPSKGSLEDSNPAGVMVCTYAHTPHTHTHTHTHTHAHTHTHIHAHTHTHVHKRTYTHTHTHTQAHTHTCPYTHT